jgi:hypothetical protein
MSVKVQYSSRDFIAENPAVIKDKLLRSDAISGFSQVAHNQISAWDAEIKLLKKSAQELSDIVQDLQISIILEFRIPRREKCLDAAILIGGTVVVIEFKVGETSIHEDDIRQIEDYALDIAYYHSYSAERRIVPILCPTAMETFEDRFIDGDAPIESIQCCGGKHLTSALKRCVQREITAPSKHFNHALWAQSPYRPIPGMIEATIELFSSHKSRDIQYSLADNSAINETRRSIEHFVSSQIKERQKILCLVTGVPGAGKTLTGLQLVHSTSINKLNWATVFLSGNGPLLKVLKEALARDYQIQKKGTLRHGRQRAQTLLHTVHSYLDESSRHDNAPTERLVVFDEAQRAWDSNKIEKMLSRQRRLSGSESQGPGSGSEPHQILSYLDRHDGPAMCVALCGIGQEIHDGEGGIEEWITARDSSFPHWQLLCSPLAYKGSPSHQMEESLHLATPVRSHRANQHTQWVDAVLRGECKEAKQLISTDTFPIYLTRDLNEARQWLRASTRGTRRSGLLASSGAARLRPYGIEVSAGFRKDIDWPHWFTGPRNDYRSSYGLEVAATEFECQGLELDKTCICWSWDLVMEESEFVPKTLRGRKWNNIKNSRAKNYAINKYRVLLTRAREGMIIWVPQGAPIDESRHDGPTDQTASFLLRCGIKELKAN